MINDPEKKIQNLCSNFVLKYQRIKKDNPEMVIAYFSSLFAAIYASSVEADREMLRAQVIDIFVTIGREVFEDHEDFIAFCVEVEEKRET